MKNVEMVVSGNKLTITVDLSKDFGDSASGKTTVIASTKGNVDVDAKNHKDVKIGLNIYKHKEKK